MRDFMWDNMYVEPIKLEDITPDKILEIEEYAQQVRIEQLTLAQLRELSDKRQELLQQLAETDIDCQLRCMRAHTLGFSKSDLAKIFNVPASVIKKWIG